MNLSATIANDAGWVVISDKDRETDSKLGIVCYFALEDVVAAVEAGQDRTQFAQDQARDLSSGARSYDAWFDYAELAYDAVAAELASQAGQ